MNCTKPFVAVLILSSLTLCAFSQEVSLSPASLSFAPQVINLVNPGSAQQTVTVTNTGGSDLNVTSVVASGGYKQTNDCTTVAAHQSCTIQVTLAPGTVGTINGAITITDNAPSSPHVVSLSGKGISPVALSPGKLGFGTVAVGSSSLPKALNLRAAPGSSFSINQISTSGNYAQTNNCPATLQNSQSCTINIVFQPTSTGTVNGALAVSTADGTVFLALSASLTGMGSGGPVSHVMLQPATLNFGNKGPDSVDSVKELTLTNTSSDTSLAIQNISLSGSPNPLNGSPLYKINSSTCAGTLAPGAQCKIEVAFSTTVSELFPQKYPGAITITDSDPSSPQVVGIFGNQTAQLKFSPPSLVFASQPVGTTTQKTVKVTGHDTEAGLVLSITTSGDFSETGDLSPCFASAGGTCSLTVSFTPTQVGTINGSVTIETYPECNPDPRELHKCPAPVVLSLTGTGQ
jgi:HYDIN/CFA65/VesB family protein